MIWQKTCQRIALFACRAKFFLRFSLEGEIGKIFICFPHIKYIGDRRHISGNQTHSFFTLQCSHWIKFIINILIRAISMKNWVQNSNRDWNRINQKNLQRIKLRSRLFYIKYVLSIKKSNIWILFPRLKAKTLSLVTGATNMLLI